MSEPLPRDSGIQRLLRRAVDVRADESAPALWSALMMFLLLGSYYIVRPVREAMGLEGGVDNLPWLYTGTFTAMLVAAPVFALLVTHTPRRVFIPAVNLFFATNLLVFAALLSGLEGEARVNAARAFYIWTSVFNLFVISVFWGFMADLWREEQGRRLFGFIAVGGTLGVIAGSRTAMEVGKEHNETLLIVSAAVLAASVIPVWALTRRFGPEREDGRRVEAALRGPRPGMWTGLILVARSPLLLGLCAYIFLFSTTSTFIYFAQARMVSEAIADAGERRMFFANLDHIVSIGELVIQLFFTGRIIRWIGLAGALAALPLVTGAGFAAITMAPVLGLVAGLFVVRRMLNFGLTKPAREVLYTILGREAKYKSKSFIDTVVYRGGDVAAGWTYSALEAAVGLTKVALVSIPLCLVWAGLGAALGETHRRRASRGTTRDPAGAPAPAA